MSEGTPPSLSDEEARRQRQAALHALAQSQLGKPAEAPAASAARATAPAPVRRPPVVRTRAARRPLPWLLIASAVLIIAVIAGLVLHQLGGLPGQAARSKAGPTSVVLTPSLQGLDCIHDVAWSPDGYLTWSPDGRYLIDSVSLFMTQRPVGRQSPTTSILQDMDLTGAPNGPIRDPALQKVFLSRATVQSFGFLPTDYVAWSPNGHLLAAISEFALPGSSGGAPIVPTVRIYNCVTGQLLATEVPQANAQLSLGQLTARAYLGASTFLRWSADGSHVLVFSSALDTITIWGPGQLPRGS